MEKISNNCVKGLIGLFTAFLIISCEKNVQIDMVQDWPQYKKDNFRSGNGAITLDLETMDENWVHATSQQPVPAWYGPAKEDTYANSGPLPSMRDYDLAYYPIIVGDKLYYGSTSDHAIHCLDANTGAELWTFTTGGPIRIAPTFYNNRLYFGSDDGYAYCIKASNGKFIWKYSPTEKRKTKVVNNNSLISFWPIRTGVLVEDDIAYFGASLLPWKPSYFCALDIKTGRPKGKSTFVRKFDDMTLEGAMASTGAKIIQPQGRISPMFFDKFSGQSKGQIPGTGGCFVLVTPEKNIVHAQTSRYNSITETIEQYDENSPENQKVFADFMSFDGGKEMVVKDSISYILTDNSISAYSRNSAKVLWTKRNYNAHRIIESNDVLYVGTTDTIYAVSTKNGWPLWKAPVNGVVYAVVVANDALYASTGEGFIYCFKSGGENNSLLTENEQKEPTVDKPEKVKNQKVTNWVDLNAGPFIKTLSPDKIEIYFKLDSPSTSTLFWTDGPNQRVLENNYQEIEHRFIIEGLKKDFTYKYQIKTARDSTKIFEFDNFFNYENSYSYKDNSILEESTIYSKAKELSNSKKGLTILIGHKNLSLGKELAQINGNKVILFESNESKAIKLRELLQNTGMYGAKFEVEHVDNYDKLPITSDLANLVVINNKDVKSDEVIRITKPKGHVLIDSDGFDFENWFSKGDMGWQASNYIDDNLIILKKAPIENTGVWTHQYGLPDNTAFGGESLWGSTGTDDFEIQWMGRPGPRFQTDRSGRKPSPLAVDGKLFVQGRERIISVDAYNGNVLWHKELPGLVRMNVLRDCSNWVADESFIYTALRNNLIKINNYTGVIQNIIPVEPDLNKSPNDWGYIGVTNDVIVGSAIPKGSNYTNYYGGEGWYDAQAGPLTDKVISYKLFGKSKKGQDDLWSYEHPNTYIINSTITLNSNRINFIVSKNKYFKLTKDLRADPNIFKNLYLISLDVNSGKVLLEKEINPKPGITTG